MRGPRPSPARLRLGFLGLLILVALGLGLARDARAQPGGGDSAHPPEAHVDVYNRTVATFRAPLFGHSPADRAQRSKLNIAAALNRIGPGEVTIQHDAHGNLLLIDGALALILTAEDADPLGGETLESASQATAAALKLAIGQSREARDRQRQLRAIAFSLAATLLYLAAWLLVSRARAWLASRLANLVERHTTHVQVAGEQLLQPTRVLDAARWFARTCAWLLLSALTYEWASFAFDQFPQTRAWSEQLDDFLLGIASHIGNAILKAVPELLIALIIFGLARATTVALGPFFDGLERKPGHRGWLDRDTAKPTRRLFNGAVWAFATVMAYPYLPGSDSEAFKGVSVLIGLMITLGGTSLFGQAASGLILIYSRSLRVGEYVRIADQEGTVTEIGTFTTKLWTGLGEEVTLSNTMVLGAVTKNYSRAIVGPGYVVDTVVTIGYDTPWRQVEAMLMAAADKTEGVLKQPVPRVFQTALSDFYVEYRLVCQALPSEPRSRAELLSGLHAQILDTFNQYGVQIMSPHYLADPSHGKLVERGAWYPAPARPPTDGGGSDS
jgi:small-conductance mechanosensitive channel